MTELPKADWPALIKSLWAPWCGYWAEGSLVLLEADGPTKTLAAIAEPPPTLYMRGHPPSGASTEGAL